MHGDSKRDSNRDSANGREKGRDQVGPGFGRGSGHGPDQGPDQDSKFNILDEIEHRGRRPPTTRRRVLRVGLASTGLIGASVAIGAGIAHNHNHDTDPTSTDHPKKVGPGPDPTPTPGRLAGPPQTPLWTRALDADGYQAALSGGTLVLAGPQALGLDGRQNTIRWQNADLRFTGLYSGPPVMVGDILYGIASGGDLVALGATDGQERWRAGAPDSTWLPSGIAGTTGDIVVCYGMTRTTTNGRADYVAGLWGVDTRAQQIAWHLTTAGDLGPGGVAVAPDFRVVAIADPRAGTLTGYNADHGTKLWQIDDPQRAANGGGGYSGGRLAAVGDAFFWGGVALYKVSALNGKQLWATPALSAGSPDIGGVFCAVADTAATATSGTGTTTDTTVPTGISTTEPQLLFATATLGTDPGALFALHTADGTRAWKQLATSDWFGVEPTMAQIGDLLLVTDQPSGSIYAVSTKDGATKWTFHDPDATVDQGWQVLGGDGMAYALYGRTVRAFRL